MASKESRNLLPQGHPDFSAIEHGDARAGHDFSLEEQGRPRRGRSRGRSVGRNDAAEAKKALKKLHKVMREGTLNVQVLEAAIERVEAANVEETELEEARQRLQSLKADDEQLHVRIKQFLDTTRLKGSEALTISWLTATKEEGENLIRAIDGRHAMQHFVPRIRELLKQVKSKMDAELYYIRQKLERVSTLKRGLLREVIWDAKRCGIPSIELVQAGSKLICQRLEAAATRKFLMQYAFHVLRGAYLLHKKAERRRIEEVQKKQEREVESIFVDTEFDTTFSRDMRQTYLYAHTLSEAGNKNMQKGDFLEAMNLFGASLIHIAHCMDDSKSMLTERGQEECKQLKAFSHLSIAICEFRMNDNKGAVASASEALRIQPKNITDYIRSLFIRAQANRALAKEMIDDPDQEVEEEVRDILKSAVADILKSAIADIKEILSISPQNESATKILAELREALKQRCGVAADELDNC
eukprot:gnl/MRDRNA2_/MRDRNA2_189386_c0_seq1.p1 gnl/MRDRNA2_/MRDRNA2_189386_c0~~gnl/MRDRNA2_/MRDRNA2_189386_c0_seq1.p1  ORF type:complete len:502 (-),score=114.96 gnl/MRDRNA2_/MRDRNA2_189386_c0_seq1:117-1529(-)